MDVDHPVHIWCQEVPGQDAHVPGEDDEVRVVAQKLGHPGLGFDHAGISHGHVVERHPEAFHAAAQVVVVAHHHGDFAGEFLAGVPPQKFHEAMIVAGDENRHPLGFVGVGQPPVHGKRRAHHLVEGVFQDLPGDIHIRREKFQAHEKRATLRVRGMLVQIDDVGPVGEEEGGDGRDDAGTILTGDAQTGGSGHARCILVKLALWQQVVGASPYPGTVVKSRPDRPKIIRTLLSFSVDSYTKERSFLESVFFCCLGPKTKRSFGRGTTGADVAGRQWRGMSIRPGRKRVPHKNVVFHFRKGFPLLTTWGISS